MTENNHYSISQISAEEALAYWESAENTSVFNHPNFLNRMSDKVVWWLGYRKQVPVILWPVCLNVHGKASLPPNTFHIGPIWLNNDFRTAVYRWFYDYLQLTHLFLDEFLKTYQGIHADLPFGILDIRPFLQYNLDHGSSQLIDYQIRYTSRISGLLLLDDEGIYELMKRDRRKKIRQQNSRGLYARATDWTEEELLQFYADFLQLKKMENIAERLAFFKNTLAVANDVPSDILFFRNTLTGEPGACYIILYGSGVANGVYALFSDSFRKGGYSPWIIFQLLKQVRDKGYDVFDFNGGNHVKLAHDKHSYGAMAYPYIRLKSSV